MNYDWREGGYILELRTSQENSRSGEAACVDSHSFPFLDRWSELFGLDSWWLRYHVERLKSYLFVHKQKFDQFYCLRLNITYVL